MANERIRARMYRQRGQALLAVISVMMLVISGSIAAVIAANGQVTYLKNKKKKRQWVNQTIGELRQFYKENAAAMDANSSTKWSTATALLKAAGVKLKYRAKLTVGKRQSSGQIDYRTLTLWIPNAKTGNSATFSPSISLAYGQVRGREIETQLMNAAKSQLGRISSELTAYYAGRIQYDPAHNVAVDYWEKGTCGPYGGGLIDCASNWTKLANLNIQGLGVVNRGSMTNPWGKALKAANESPIAHDQSPPFTLRLESPLPWGSGLTTSVVEPITSGG